MYIGDISFQFFPSCSQLFALGLTNAESVDPFNSFPVAASDDWMVEGYVDLSLSILSQLQLATATEVEAREMALASFNSFPVAAGS